MEKGKYSRFQLAYFASFLFSAVINVSSVSLDSDGYYHIVIAIHEKTAQNSNENYIDNLKAGIQDLSDAIFESTGKSFSIRSADIVLPNHWNTESDAFVTTQNYQNADIRISHEYPVPQTINPTFCGYPGHHIELPYNYFDEKDTGLYGPTGKSLLTLWARYRWGIFEEHGFPGDSQFPYYWKDWAPWIPVEEGEEPLPEKWKVTSCANAEMKGKFETIDTKQECGPDYVPPEDTTLNPIPTTENPVPTTENPVPTTLDPVLEAPDYPPPSECRFIPEIENQTATTSLMSFPYIKSLLSFCDETNHNKRAPNRQNLFCQFKSAWEVIKLSKDWRQLKNPAGSGNKRAPINYRIVKKSEKPLLFILSEGVNQPPEDVVSAMASELDVIFNKSQHWNVLASAGVFPGRDTRNSYDSVYQWNTPWYDREELITAFTESFGSRENTMFRPFGAAIQDIGNMIKGMEHSAGAVIVVIKFGSETVSMQNQFQVYESEVLATIVTQNIRLFALEGIDNQADSPSPFRLKNLAETSGGLHFEIGTGNNEQDLEHVSTVMSEVDSILNTGPVRSSRYRLAYKDSRRSKGDVKITLPVQVNYHNVKSVTFYFHPLMDSTAISGLEISSGPDGIISLPNFESICQWGKTETMYKSFLAKWTAIPGQPLLNPSTWYYTFLGEFVTDTDTLTVVLAELGDDENEVGSDDITIAISTSADEDDNIVDLNVETAASLKGTAFSIYALLEKNGHPINSPELEVTAHVLHFLEGSDADFDAPVKFAPTINLNLMDNGNSVDLTATDGIYSGTFVASDQFVDRGVFQIFVTAKLLQTTVTRLDSSASYQLTQKCGSGYQGCWSETVTEPFFRAADLTRRIKFIGTATFVGAASRVLDLRASELSPGRYNIEWTEPSLPIGRTNEFQIYFANDFDQLLGEIFRDQVFDVPYPSGNPGTTHSIIVDNLEEGENRWYLLRSRTLLVTPAPPLVWSNVMFVHASSSFFQTTTTTTTTTTPQPTSSTTRLPTVPPGSSTIPTQATTTSPTTTTTTRRTAPTTTTRPSTTEPTTTTVRTTVKLEVTTEKNKRWYKTPEAIATFSVFIVGMFIIAGGLLMYIKMVNRE